MPRQAFFYNDLFRLNTWWAGLSWATRICMETYSHKSAWQLERTKYFLDPEKGKKNKNWKITQFLRDFLVVISVSWQGLFAFKRGKETGIQWSGPFQYNQRRSMYHIIKISGTVPGIIHFNLRIDILTNQVINSTVQNTGWSRLW